MSKEKNTTGTPELFNIKYWADEQEFKLPYLEIEKKRENVASFLAIAITFVYIVTIFLPPFLPDSADYIKSILPSVATLLGVAFGFYFSQKRL